ncbi:MAG: hypothetical protein BJ554DRAFT_1081, partial [Olpidium bornovanus]
LTGAGGNAGPELRDGARGVTQPGEHEGALRGVDILDFLARVDTPARDTQDTFVRKPAGQPQPHTHVPNWRHDRATQTRARAKCGESNKQMPSRARIYTSRPREFHPGARVYGKSMAIACVALILQGDVPGRRAFSQVANCNDGPAELYDDNLIPPVPETEEVEQDEEPGGDGWH